MKKSHNLPDDSDLDTISKRLKYVIEQSGVKQSHIAKKLGVTRGAVHHILNSEVKNPKNAKKIADLLGIDPEWLATGKNTVPLRGAVKGVGTDQQLVPVYYLDQLLMQEQNPHTALTPITHVFAQHRYQTALFAIQLSRPSPFQKFESGDIVLLSQQSSCAVGDWILVYQTQAEQIFFGVALWQDEETLVLLHQKAENPISINLKIDCVKGVFVEAIKYAKG